MKKTKIDKEPFKFTYTEPWLDWYKEVKVEINWNDYVYFHLERRYDNSWYLIGINYTDEPYRRVTEDLGRISTGGGIKDLARFIQWAKFPGGGSKIVGISAISGAFDILEDVSKLLQNIKSE